MHPGSMVNIQLEGDAMLLIVTLEKYIAELNVDSKKTKRDRRGTGMLHLQKN